MTINKKLIFDSTFTTQHSFPSADIDAIVGFFLKHNFDMTSANSMAIVLLNYARDNSMSAYALLDTLKPMTELQLSDTVLTILNSNRDYTSRLSNKTENIYDLYELRNVVV